MKKVKIALLILLLVTLIVPNTVKAENKNKNKETKKEVKETTKETKKEEVEKEDIAPTPDPTYKPVKMYLFCEKKDQYCEITRNWFKEAEKDFGKYYELVYFDITDNYRNQNILNKVKTYFKVSDVTTPYLVIGNYSYTTGFLPTYPISEEETMGTELLYRMFEMYYQESRFDVLEKLGIDPNKEENNVGIIIVSSIIIVGAVTFIVLAKKNNKY